MAGGGARTIAAPVATYRIKGFRLGQSDTLKVTLQIVAAQIVAQ